MLWGCHEETAPVEFSLYFTDAALPTARRLPRLLLPPPHTLVSIKLAFHDEDTDTNTDWPNTATILRPTHAISSRGSRRECPCRIPRHRHGLHRKDPREEMARVGRMDV